MKKYIQPFERKLALQELRALAAGPVIPVDGDDATASIFSVDGVSDARALRGALAYWHSVGDHADGVTEQLRGEATLTIARGGAAPDKPLKDMRALVSSKLPNKRCLRYATHGLHEYRGKFFPQLVRALMNIAQLSKDAVVLDPMCGSGTTLVEARLSGRKSYGLDLNPLSVFVTDVKCRALTLKPMTLSRACEDIQTTLETPVPTAGRYKRTASLASNDRFYLERWFDLQTLVELDHIEAVVSRLPTITLRNFYRVCMSNILRGVSWPKNDDLRVRRERTKLETGETIARFLQEATRSTRTVAAFLEERGQSRLGSHKVREADARHAASFLQKLIGKVDAVITSPPYATALPYLDTDRLSLIYLGLLPREGHRRRDALMIGNRREVTTRSRPGILVPLRDEQILAAPGYVFVDRTYRTTQQVTTGGFSTAKSVGAVVEVFLRHAGRHAASILAITAWRYDVPGCRKQPDNGRRPVGRDPHRRTSWRDRARYRVSDNR